MLEMWVYETEGTETGPRGVLTATVGLLSFLNLQAVWNDCSAHDAANAAAALC